MYQRHYIFLKAVMLSFVMRDTGTVIIYCLLYESFFFLCDRLVYINPESWPVVDFCPHVESTGVFGTYLNTLYPIFGSLKEVFIIANQAIRL